MKPWVYQALKMVLGTLVAIEVATLLGLDYSVTAGVIVLLSIQSTKIKSLQLAVRRTMSSFLGLLIAVAVFSLFGYNVYMFILILLIFIPLAFGLKLEDGIVVSAVLISHVLIGKNLSLALNAVYILIIGVTTAVLINLYMPSFKRTIEKEMDDIDNSLKNQIKCLMSESMDEFDELESLIDKATKRIQTESDNRLFTPKDMNIEYVLMRKEQLRYLKEINADLKKVNITSHKQIVTNFLCEIKSGIGKENMAKPLLVKLEALHVSFKAKALPQTREEFEERAILYHILFDIEGFLMAKVNYHTLIG